jgi:hypothetical protein
MNIEEIKLTKHQCELSIAAIVNTFAKYSGCRVDNISFLEVTRIGYPYEVFVRMDVRIDDV